MMRTAAGTPTGDGERLAKRVAALVPCSRSQAEQYIEGGCVSVDGMVVEEPQFRVTHQHVTVDAQARLLDMAPVTLLLHKPADCTDGMNEPPPPGKGRKPVMDAQALLVAKAHFAQDTSGVKALQRHLRKQESMVALETGASGLLVFTQDWRVNRKLVEDMASMEHELIADVAGAVSPDALRPMLHALNDPKQQLPPVKVSVNSSTPERSKLRLAVKGAHPGLVAYVCEKAGLQLLALRRIRLGRVALSDLPPEQWRYLAPHERF